MTNLKNYKLYEFILKTNGTVSRQDIVRETGYKDTIARLSALLKGYKKTIWT